MRPIICTALFICFSLSQIHSQNFVWAERIGNVGIEGVMAMDVDSAGNIVIVGYGDFETQDTIVAVSYDEIFVAKLSSQGEVQWVKLYQGNISASMLKIDDDGNIYIGGSFNGTLDFDPGPGTYELTPPYLAKFLVKLDVNGNFRWVKSIEYDNNNEALELRYVEIDNSNNVWVGGGYQSSGMDFDWGSGIYTLDSTTYWNSFVIGVDTSGSMLWAASIDSSYACSMGFDPYGDLIITGYAFGGGDYDLDPDTFNYSSPGIFFLKLTSAGNLIWVRGGIQTPTNDYLNTIAIDYLGDIYTIGIFQGTVDFDPGWDYQPLTANGITDYYILKLSQFGDYLWAENIGPKDYSYSPASIALDGYQNIFVSGQFMQTVDFDFGLGNYSKTSIGSADMFIAKYNTNGALIWAESLGGNTVTSLKQMIVDNNGGITFTGGIRGAGMDCDPGFGDSILTPNSFGLEDIFLIKWIDSTSIIGIETINDDPFIVYPNPFNDQITIDGIDEPTQTILFNSLGERIGNWKIDSDNSTIPMYGLKSGIYFLQLQSKKHLITKKIIKS